MAPITRRGNKNRLIHETDFISYFPRPSRSSHYCEPFAGTCEVALHYLDSVKKYNYVVTLNDGDGELINFWKVLAQYPHKLEARLRPAFPGIKLDENDEIDRAVNFWIENQQSSFLVQYPITPIKHFDPIIDALNHHRTVFTQQDWKKCMEVILKLSGMRGDDKRYRDVIFYLDPPYYNTDATKRKNLCAGYDNINHEEMAAFLNGIKDINRLWIFLSHHDCEFIRDAYKDWHFMSLKTMGDSGRSPLTRPRMELLISNRSFMRWGDQALDNFVGG